MKTLAEIYTALEGNEATKALIEDIKGNFSTVSNEAKDKRIANEGLSTEVGTLKTMMESMTGAIAKLQGVEPEKMTPEAVDMDLIKRKLAEMDELKTTFTATQDELDKAKADNVDLARISALTKASKALVNDGAMADFIALHKDKLIQASDGEWQTSEGVSIEKYVEDSLEKRSYFKTNPIAQPINGVKLVNSGTEMSEVDKFNQRVSEIQAGK